MITLKQNNILSTIRPVTPVELYKNQVKGIMEGIRVAGQGLSYIPPQFGGLMGQRQVLNEAVSLQIIDFKVY